MLSLFFTSDSSIGRLDKQMLSKHTRLELFVAD